MPLETFPFDKANESLIARIKHLPPEVTPGDEFVYWTRRMLLNAMAASSEEDVTADIDTRDEAERRRGAA